MPYTQKIHRNVHFFLATNGYECLRKKYRIWITTFRLDAVQNDQIKTELRANEIESPKKSNKQTEEEEGKKQKKMTIYWAKREATDLWVSNRVPVHGHVWMRTETKFPLIFSHSKFYLDVISVLLASRHEHISCYWWRSLLRAFANRSNWINTHTYGGIHITWYTIPRRTHTHTHTSTQVSDQHMREFISLRESWILSRNPINLLAATSTQILTILTNSFVFLCVIYLARSIFLNFMLRMKLLSWFNRSIFTGLLVYLPLHYHFFLVLFLYFFAGSFASCAFFSFLFLINIWVFVASDQLIELDDSLWIFIEPDLVSNFFSLSLKSNRIYIWWMSIICNCFYYFSLFRFGFSVFDLLQSVKSMDINHSDYSINNEWYKRRKMSSEVRVREEKDP